MDIIDSVLCPMTGISSVEIPIFVVTKQPLILPKSLICQITMTQAYRPCNKKVKIKCVGYNFFEDPGLIS